jgi:hypothetical protein
MNNIESPSKRHRGDTVVPTKVAPLVTVTTATITFSDTFQPERYKIIEAPEDILRAVNSGSALTLKGTEGVSDAVLCTENKTYSLKKVETSNTVFLVPPSSDRFQVVSKSAQFYEVHL